MSLKAAYDALARKDYEACAQIVARLKPLSASEQAETYYVMSLALEGVGKVKEALMCANKACSVQSTGRGLAHMARLASQLHQNTLAQQAATQALAHSGNDAVTLDTIGNVFARLGDHETAIQAFEQAVKADPHNTGFRFNLAASHGFFGNTDAAEHHYTQIIAQDPRNARAWFGRVRLRRQTEEQPALDRAIQEAETPSDAVRLRYAAAKVAEDLGQHARVYANLSAANTLHKAHQDTSIELELDNIATLKETFSQKGYFQGSSTAADAPIFITGMPRTGTTLTDRIISSHAQVTSAGELQAMPITIKQLAQSASRAILDRDTINLMSTIRPHQVGAAYGERARQNEGAQTGRFIDKLPLNFLYIGYIARALPNAAIICLRRRPMDTIWSNYKNLFATTSLYYRYSYDLEDAARYYIQFDALMAFWKSMFPGRIFELSYEGLIADQEGLTRALLQHCGLSWDPACLDFQNNAAAVATPSAAQVRQPLSDKAIGQWRPYEAQMEKAKAILQDAGINPI